MIDLGKLPEPSDKNIAVRVKPAAERAIRQGHPWVFEESIVKQSHLGNAGDLAVIYDRDKNRFLAVGLYDPFSPIRIKILQREQPERINFAWFVNALEVAQARRQPLIDKGITGYRLVYGESDRLPALVIDRYGDTLVMKLYTVAWLPQMKTLIAAMRKNAQIREPGFATQPRHAIATPRYSSAAWLGGWPGLAWRGRPVPGAFHRERIALRGGCAEGPQDRILL